MAATPWWAQWGVKSVGTFPVILVKLVTPPLPPQTKLILSTMGGNECFFWPQHCWREWGDDGMNPRQIENCHQEQSAICNRLFHTVPSSLVPHCSPCFKVVCTCDNPEYDDHQLRHKFKQSVDGKHTYIRMGMNRRKRIKTANQ